MGFKEKGIVEEQRWKEEKEAEENKTREGDVLKFLLNYFKKDESGRETVSLISKTWRQRVFADKVT